MEVPASSNRNIYLVLSIIMVVILVTAIAAIISWHSLDKTSRDLMLTTGQSQEKNEITVKMWDGARERHAVLLALVIEDDPVKKENLIAQHQALGSRFTALKQQLLAMQMNSTESAYLSALLKAIASSAPVQEQVRNLAMENAREQAQSIIKNPDYIRDRLTIFRIFNAIFEHYRKSTEAILNEVNNTTLKYSRLIIEIMSLVLILSAAIGFFMTRIVVASEAELHREISRRTDAQRELELHRTYLEDRIQHGIDKYKCAEAERMQSHEKAIAFGKILEDSLNEIYIFDADSLKFIQVNKGARENLGYSMNDLKNITPIVLKPEVTEADFRQVVAPLLDGSQNIVHFSTVHMRKDGTTYPVNVNLQLSLLGETRVFVSIIMDMTERQQVDEELQRKNHEIEKARNELLYQQKAVDKHAIVCIADKNECLTGVNDKFVEISGFTQEELIGGHFCIGISDKHAEEFFVGLSSKIQSGNIWSGEICSQNKDGENYWTMTTITPFLDENGAIYKFVIVSTDITAQKLAKEELHIKNIEIEQAHQDLAQSHQQTLQSEKLASVGQLAAGIAHEINTPIQFVGDNTRFLQESFADLMRLVTAYEAMGKADGEDGVPAELAEKARSLSEEIEVDYLEEEVPKAIAQSLEGIDRVSRIVRSMKDFSHPGSDKKEIIDINQSIESTVTVSRNEWKYHAELVTDFDEVLKAVPCFPGELNQVVLNMIVNASHAIADFNDGDTGTQGIITITTRLAGGFAEIRIGDTGTGMTEEIRNRIFEPFFTTKGVGKGSGQGLAIAYAVVVEKHKGSIDVESEPGKGTTFIIRLPMRDSADDAETFDAEGAVYEQAV